MKKIFYLLFISSVVLASCKKKEEYQCNCEKTIDTIFRFDQNDNWNDLDFNSETSNEYVMARSMEKAEKSCNDFNYVNYTDSTEYPHGSTNQVYYRTYEIYNCTLE